MPDLSRRTVLKLPVHATVGTLIQPAAVETPTEARSVPVVEKPEPSELFYSVWWWRLGDSFCADVMICRVRIHERFQLLTDQKIELRDLPAGRYRQRFVVVADDGEIMYRGDFEEFGYLPEKSAIRLHDLDISMTPDPELSSLSA